MTTKGRDTKPHIGIFGRRNYGKSSLINAMTGQDTAIVSDVPGTTTDPVKKSIEIAGLGPVIMIDTAGIDDSGELGKKRMARSKATLKIIDLAILLIIHNVFDETEADLIREFRQFNIPFIFLHNKSDEEPLRTNLSKALKDKYSVPVIDFSAHLIRNMEEVISAIQEQMPETAYTAENPCGRSYLIRRCRFAYHPHRH